MNNSRRVHFLLIPGKSYSNEDEVFKGYTDTLLTSLRHFVKRGHDSWTGYGICYKCLPYFAE